ncbi:YitT family protein [Clostridium neuense]|uniref:YitT family protein n=1 Tax=Clostridium neuense TaxID=1728934 RepID=A0ABW8TM54_9CLOT
MKRKALIILRLFIGLILCSIGTVMTINGNLGFQPWDVFHQGISIMLNITMGQASIIVSAIVIIIDYIAGEKIGWGTIFNMLVIGTFMDILMLNHLLPVFNNEILRIVSIIIGMLSMSIGSYMYIGAGLGSGPRDGLMVALTKKTKKSVFIVRTVIELFVLVIGYIMGGSVGIGTIIMVSLVGYFIQMVFKIFKFDVNKVKHRFINDDIKYCQGTILRRVKKIL